MGLALRENYLKHLVLGGDEVLGMAVGAAICKILDFMSFSFSKKK